MSAAVAMGLSLAAGCGAQDADASALGPDCQALLQLGARAAACSAELGPLVEQIRAAPLEPKCSQAARALLQDPEVAVTRPRSLFEPEAKPNDGPLDTRERIALGEFVLPATVEIELDVPLEPGVASTRAELGSMALTAAATGALRAEVRPGAYRLRLHHAGRSSEYCVQLSPCMTTRVIAHGARLARHPDLTPGPC